MKQKLEQVIAELWAKVHEHTEGSLDAESLFEQKRDEGAAEAYQWAAIRLREVIANADGHTHNPDGHSTDDGRDGQADQVVQAD